MKPKPTDLTKENLRDLFEYDPETGIFTRKIKRAMCKAGSIAGCLHVRGYVTIRVYNRKYYAHRLAWLYMTGDWPDMEVDHINGVRSDNRFSNLRLATTLQNIANSKVKKTSGFKYKGVYCDYRVKSKPWRAYISDHGKKKWLGSFQTEDEAAMAYLEAAQRIHGNFARII